MKSWKVLIVIALVLLTISWVIVTPEKKSFSVLSQRVDNSKSSAITEFWDGAGSFVDMIWQWFVKVNRFWRELCELTLIYSHRTLNLLAGRSLILLKWAGKFTQHFSLRLFTVLQAWSTVAWSLFPHCCPMLARLFLVSCFEKYILNCLAWTISRFRVFDFNNSSGISK